MSTYALRTYCAVCKCPIQVECVDDVPICEECLSDAVKKGVKG